MAEPFGESEVCVKTFGALEAVVLDERVQVVEHAAVVAVGFHEAVERLVNVVFVEVEVGEDEVGVGRRFDGDGLGNQLADIQVELEGVSHVSDLFVEESRRRETTQGLLHELLRFVELVVPYQVAGLPDREVRIFGKLLACLLNGLFK